MRISLYSQSDLRSNVHYGYGKSFVEITKAFRKYTHNNNRLAVEWNSPRSKIQMYYGPHPIENAHHKHQYKIHMSQVESTKFQEHKVKAYSSVDEFWTASEWGRDAAINSGINPEKVFVYHHGIDPDLYTPFLRGNKNKIRFLHIDSGSSRKRSDLVEDAFNVLYKKNKNIELTLKYSHHAHKGKSWLLNDTLENSGNWIRPGTRHVDQTLSNEEMVSLINFHDVLVYPSEGEGFGMIPLEVLATGMPVISTHEWAPYSNYFEPGKLESDIKPSAINWGYNKEGNGTIVKFDSLIDKMQHFIDNINTLSGSFYSQVDSIKNEYAWQNVTNLFLDNLVDRVGTEYFEKPYKIFGDYQNYSKVL
jgi:glycosyltransferase involved in cell wall biosynthesis